MGEGGGGMASLSLHLLLYIFIMLCLICVHTSSSDGSSILSVGQWSERGCTKNEVLSNTSVTVCECTHLTHFAIMLSAKPRKLPKEVTLSLEVIGYVGVSISLVAMTLTVLTFVTLR